MIQSCLAHALDAAFLHRSFNLPPQIDIPRDLLVKGNQWSLRHDQGLIEQEMCKAIRLGNAPEAAKWGAILAYHQALHR